MSVDAAYARAQDVVVSRRGGSAFLTRLDTGEVYEANEVALLVFEAASRGAPAALVADEVARAFPEVPADEVERDVHDALATLLDAGLLQASPR